MTVIKRSRGRPKGTGIDDSAVLAQIADFILREPRLRPTTAYKRIVGKEAAKPTPIRRIQQKWTHNKPQLLAAAAERRDMAKLNTASAARARSQSRLRSATEEAALQISTLLSDINSGNRAKDAVRGLAGTIARDVARYSDFATVQAELETTKKMRGILDSPAIKAMRSLDDVLPRDIGLGTLQKEMRTGFDVMREYDKVTRMLRGY